MTPHERYLEVAAELGHLGVSTGQLFGKSSLMAGKKSFSCLFGTGLACRLGAGTAEHTTALAMIGTELFDPSGSGRAMKDWVVLPFAVEAQWTFYAEAALRYLGSQ